MHRATPAILLALLGAACNDEPLTGGLSVELSVELHPEQPMIADVVVKLDRPASVRLQVPTDPGARVGELGTDELGVLRARIRGLAPATDHTVELVAGASSRSVTFTTPVPLPGFVPSFAVSGAGSDDYRLFDYSETRPDPDITESRLIAIDAAGTTRFYLPSPSAGESDIQLRAPAGVKILEDGRLLFVQDGRLLILDELGNKQLDLDSKSLGVAAFHHDVLELPGGNLLVLGYEFGDFPHPISKEIVHVAGDVIVELGPAGDVVWSWSSFEHLDTSRAPAPEYNLQFRDPRTGKLGFDWTHGNGIVYREQDDSILVSLRHQDWIVKIDHASGNVTWRLGKDGDFTLSAGSWFFHQHSAEWQADGTLLLYDNGNGNPDLEPAKQRSRPVLYRLDETARTATQIWDETNEHYLSIIAGDADRTSDGAILVLDSSLLVDPTPPFKFELYSRLREVDPATNEWRWTLVTDDNRFIYRALPVRRLPGEPL
jgi:hypothetical protein